MRTQFAGTVNLRFSPEVAAATRPIQKLWSSLFGGIAWPYIELAIRLWIAKLFGFFGFIEMLHRTHQRQVRRPITSYCAELGGGS